MMSGHKLVILFMLFPSVSTLQGDFLAIFVIIMCDILPDFSVLTTFAVFKAEAKCLCHLIQIILFIKQKREYAIRASTGLVTNFQKQTCSHHWQVASSGCAHCQVVTA